MADNYSIDSLKESSFNDAKLKMIRIHRLQDIMNLCALNLLGAYNGSDETGLFANGQRNFQIYFNAAGQYYQEIKSKLHDDDRNKVETKQNTIEEFMIRYPVTQIVDKINDKEEKVNLINWIVLKKALKEFETLVRDMGDKHGFGPENKKDPRLAIISN